MKKLLSNQNGITLTALVITIIVLLILTTIGIGVSGSVKRNIAESKDAVALSDLSFVQQAVMETYIKYKQTGNENILIGTIVENSVAQEELTKIDNTLILKKAESSTSEEKYYKLQKTELESIGVSNTDDDEYIVNYSTGEVFNITQRKTGLGNILYKYAR